MQFTSDWSVYGVRTLLLLGAFGAFSWALLSARRQAAEAHAQIAARLETALNEIRRLSGQVIALGGSIETLGARLTQAQAQAQAQSQARAAAQQQQAQQQQAQQRAAENAARRQSESRSQGDPNSQKEEKKGRGR